MRTVTIIFIVSLVFGREVSAQISISNKSEDEVNYLLDLSLAGVGGALAILSHEGFHLAGGWIVDRKLKFNDEHIGGIDLIDLKEWNNEEKRIVSMSGFLGPLLVSETLLRLVPDSPITVGFVVMHAGHNLFYVGQDALGFKDDKYNDFETMRKAGIGPIVSYPLAALPPLINLWRLFQDENFKNNLWDIYFGPDNTVGVKISFR